MRRRLFAAALALALGLDLAGSSGAAPAPVTTLDLGGATGYVRPDPGAPLAGVQLFVPAGLARQTGTQSGLAALAAETILRTPVDGLALVEAVAAGGGSLGYAVAPGYVRFHLQATPDALPRLAALVARGLAAPAYDPPVLAAARAELGDRIAAGEADPVAVGLGMVRASYYRGGAGEPPLGTPASLAGYSAADVRGFHDRWYLRGGALLAAVGRTGPASEAAGRALVAALPAGSAPPASVPTTRPFLKEPRRLVTHRDIGGPYAVLGFAAPALGDRDFAPVLVVRALLGDVLGHSGATTLSPRRRGVGTVYGYDVRPAQFVLWLGGELDPAAGLTALAAVVKRAGQAPLAPAVLARYKEAARGAWRLESLSLEDRAWALGNAAALGLDPAAADGLPAAIGAVGPADVQRVAKRYFQQFDLALVLPRGGAG